MIAPRSIKKSMNVLIQRDASYFDILLPLSGISCSPEKSIFLSSFMAPFPQGRKPDTINPGPAGSDDIMADNWSFKDLSTGWLNGGRENRRKEERVVSVEEKGGRQLAR